ncbi:MAG: hypothetical protein AAF367_04135 [Pseudomonadota bacterium]
MASISDRFSVEIDLRLMQTHVRAAQDLLEALRAKHDLRRWEYTKHVRIAPFEIPHSHPVLTLNSRYAVDGGRDEDAFLSVYLHEQIHWGIVMHRDAEVEQAILRLMPMYPDAHTSEPDSASDAHSTYLHFVVNWLEVGASSEFIGHVRAEAAVLRSPVYRQIYRVVIEEWEQIGAVLKEAGVLPFPEAG